MVDNRVELVSLTEKIQESCQCFDCNDGSDIQEYVEKFLTVLAQLFCWVDKDCATILKSERQETLDLKGYEICNCQAFFEFRPYYHKGFDPSTLKLYVHKRQGMNREVYEVPADKYSYDFIDGTVIVDMTEIVNPCCQCVCECECKSTYKLVALYEAGYTAETMPRCVLDALCHFLQVFIAYQNDCGSFNDCARMDRLAVGSVLKSKSVDYLIRTWEVDENSLELAYTKLIHKWEFKTLSMLSLCKYDNRELYISLGKDRKCY